MAGCTTPALAVKMTLKAAMEADLVRVSGSASGQSFMKKGLKLRIESRSKDQLELTIDPALVFKPDDTMSQDLMLAGHERTTIATGGSKELELQSYCAKSYAHAPAKGLSFTYRKQADSNTIRVLDYIRQHGILNETAQHAVWVMTNQHELSSVYDPAQDLASRKLIAFMAQVLHAELPAYYKQYTVNTTPGRPVFEGKALKIYALFQWKADSPQYLKLAVYNEAGKQIDLMFENRLFKPGGYELMARFSSSSEPPGNYYIRLSSPAGILKETKVQIE
jgi:hypothetical protein